ncbi:MAG: hypothetical protein KC800_08295 [Candidatus Eremiobacteraeota bacterium]|nr:hypothetical protein [Candidatus Eremiobacteraeota bacterium]
MFIIKLFWNREYRGLRLEHLQMLQLISQQVVFSLEDMLDLTEEEKKKLAFTNVRELFSELGHEAPDEFIEISVEAGVRLARSLKN